MMEVFVLSILRYDVLDLLEVFDTYRDAHEYAIKFCDIAGLEQEYRLNRRSDQMRGWVIAESPKYFISILERKVSLLSPMTTDSSHEAGSVSKGHARDAVVLLDLPTKLNSSAAGQARSAFGLPSLMSYNDLNDVVSGKSPVVMPAPNATACVSPVMKTEIPATAPPVNVSSKPRDDAYADNLPAGFQYSSNRPLVMSDIVIDPDSPILIDSLSENQKWALVIARINKRPHFKIELDSHWDFDQAAALEALKTKSIAGIKIRDKELALLEEFYAKCVDDKKSSYDDFYYDESSSSDWNS